MKRRWLIRSFFITLLLLCVGVWGWSYISGGSVWFKHNDVGLGIGGISGECFTCCPAGSAVPEGLNCVRVPNGEWSGVVDCPSTHSSFGFLICNDSHANFLIAIPFWFITAVLALVTFYVWRRTGKKKPGKAFPVEMDKAGA